MDLFDDLPAPTADAAAVTNGSSVKTSEKEREVAALPDAHSLKRKSIDDVQCPPVDAKIKKNGDLCSLKSYCCERQGEREEMQDAHVIMDSFTNLLLPAASGDSGCILRAAYYGVFDGHVGARASAYAAKHLHVNIAAKFPKGNMEIVERDIKRCILEAYKKTDEDFLKEATKTKPSWKDGTTATTLLVLNNTMYVANIGDSRAVLCRKSKGPDGASTLLPIVLTKDHCPTDYDERMRVQKAGGTVRDGRVQGQLEVSRSIGDGPYKTHGVVSIPDVKRCVLTDNDRFIIIACDGLWKTFTSEEAVAFVDAQLQQQLAVGTEIPEGRSIDDCKYEQACNRIVAESLRKLSGDNVTALIVMIKPPI